MISINLAELETFDIDTSNLPRGESFTGLLELFDDYNVSLSQQHLVAMEYYRQGLEKEFEEILRHAIKSAEFLEEEQNESRLLLNALLVKRGEVPNFGEEHDLLKGICSLRQKDFSRAEYFFKKCRFELGTETVEFLENKKQGYQNETLASLNNYRTNKPYTKENLNKILRARIDKEFREELNLAGKFVEGTLEEVWTRNVDVMLSIADDLIETREDIARQILEGIAAKGEGYASNILSEVSYLRGKMEHLKGNYKEAVVFYNESNLPLAKYNKARIEQKYDPSIEEVLRYYSGEKRFEPAVNLYLHLTDKIDNKYHGPVYDFLRAKEFPSVVTYRKLMENEFVDQFIVYNNLAFYLWLELEKFKTSTFVPLEGTKQVSVTNNQSIKEIQPNFLTFGSILKSQKERIFELFRKSLEFAPDEYKETIEENIKIAEDGGFERNEEKLKEMSDLTLLGYFYLYQKSLTNAKKILKDDSLALGYIQLQLYMRENKKSYLNEAIEYLKKCNSVYAINLISVCLIYLKRYNEARILLEKLVTEFPLAFINLGNLNVITKRNEEAINCFKKVPLSNYTYNILGELAIKEKNNLLISELLSFKKDENLVRKLIETGRYTEEEIEAIVEGTANGYCREIKRRRLE